MVNFIDDSRVHEGHRSRMRSKLVAHGQRIFDTYELLEMLLYQVIPCRDTNPVAKNLLYAFNGLDGVLSAKREELVGISGIGGKVADFLISVGRLSEVIGAEIVEKNDYCFSEYETVGRFFASYFAGVEQKQVVGLFLDNGMQFISMKKLYDLDYDSGGVKAKPFIDEAVKNHAVVVISAHNHPHGPFYPTEGDRATNSLITDSLNMAGIVHAEHFIISGGLFAGIGSLKSFSVKLSQMPEVTDFINSRDKYVGKLHSVDPSSCEKANEISQAGYNITDRDYFAHLIGYCSTIDADKGADLLLRKYKTIENCFTAPISEIAELTDIRLATYLKLLAYVTSRRVTDRIVFGRKYSGAAIAEYLKALFLGESIEKTYLLVFDKSDRLTGVELLGEGTVNASEVMPRKAIEIAVRLSASSVSIAHNHPFGRVIPSSDDVKMTQAFGVLFNSCDIKLKDHFIVAGQLCDTVE